MSKNHFFLLFLLIISAYTNKNRHQSTLKSTAKIFSELKSHNLGKILLGLAEVTPPGGYEDLFNTLDLLANGLEQKIKTQTDLYNNAESLHNSAAGSYQSMIESIQGGIADLEQSLNNNLSPALTQAENDIKRLEERISSTQQQIVEATSIRNQEKSDYEQRNKDLSDGIDSINEALSLLGGLLTDEGADVELVQTQRQTLLQIKNKLQKKLSNLRNAFEYKPIIEALTQITLNNDYVDQKILKKIISLLAEIRDSLEEMIVELQGLEEKAAVDFENTIQNANDDLDLTQRILGEDQQKQKDLNQQISNTNTALEQKKSSLETNQQSLDSENSDWQQKKQGFDEILGELQKEREIVKQCVSLLNSGEIVSS